MKTEQQIIAEELAKHGVTPAAQSAAPKQTTPADVEEVKPKAMSPKSVTKAEPKVTSAVEPRSSVKTTDSKKTKVTVQLTDAEVGGLTREANLLGQTWQEHFGTLVLEMLDKRVAKTLITGPSYATKKVTGPSKIGGHYFGA